MWRAAVFRATQFVAALAEAVGWNEPEGVYLTFQTPGSSSGTSWFTDQRIFARGWAGGTAARSYVHVTVGDTIYAVSLNHGGSWSDPTEYVAELSSATHAVATLPSGHCSGVDVAEAIAAAFETMGLTCRVGSIVVEGRTYGTVGVLNATLFGTGTSRNDFEVGSGRLGCKRVYAGTDAEQGSVTHNDWIWERIGTAATDGFITSVGCHGVSNYQPRLAVAIGGPYATPGTFTSIRYGDLAAPLTNHSAGVVTFEALPVSAGQSVWLGSRSDGTGGLSRRAHTATPTGQFDWTLNEPYRIASDAASVVEGGTQAFTFTSTADFYTTLFCTFEDEAGGYQRNGIFQATWLGCNRPAANVAANSPTPLVPQDANDSFRLTPMPLQHAQLRGGRIANGTANALNGMLFWVYTANDLNRPFTTPGSLLGRATMTTHSANSFNAFTFDSVIEVGAETVSAPYLVAGNCWGRISGGGAPTGTQILFDAADSGGSTEDIYLAQWPANADMNTWSDHVIDPMGLGGANGTSPAQYYQTQTGRQPRNVADATLNSTFQVSSGAPADTTFGSLLRYSLSLYPSQLPFQEVA